MIETEGVVVVTTPGSAWVETNRRSACGHCESSGACGTSLLANTFGNKPTRVEVANGLGARVGDRVVLGLPEGGFLLGSLLLYLLPLAGLLVGALLGQFLAIRQALALVEPWAVLGGLLGLTAALGLLRIVDISRRDPGRFQPVMVRRLARAPVVELSRIPLTKE